MIDWSQRRLRGVGWERVDQLAALALLIVIELQVWLSPGVSQRTPSALAGLAMSLAVAVRRRWTMGAVLVGLAALAGQRALGAQLIGQVAGAQAAAVLLFYGMGAFLPADRSVLMLGLALVVSSVSVLSVPGHTVTSLAPKLMFPVILPWVLGRVSGHHRARERRDRELAERLDADRELYARTAAYGERSRIARELHDVIAHSVSVMVIQAGGARLVMDSDAERAEASLRSVERAGREALAEMRRLLGVLDGDSDARALTPQPGLADINELLADTRDSGLLTDLYVDGEPVTMSPALDLCAYRIVQEALTNAIKHAGPARAQVRVRWEQGALELEISDDGRGPIDAGASGSGHGIVGMHERAALHGGSVHTGAGTNGGFTVSAWLPLAAEPGQ